MQQAASSSGSGPGPPGPPGLQIPTVPSFHPKAFPKIISYPSAPPPQPPSAGELAIPAAAAAGSPVMDIDDIGDDDMIDTTSSPPAPPSDPGGPQQRIRQGAPSIFLPFRNLPPAPPSVPHSGSTVTVPMQTSVTGSSLGPSAGSQTAPLSLPPLQVPSFPPGSHHGPQPTQSLGPVPETQPTPAITTPGTSPENALDRTHEYDHENPSSDLDRSRTRDYGVPPTVPPSPPRSAIKRTDADNPLDRSISSPAHKAVKFREREEQGITIISPGQSSSSGTGSSPEIIAGTPPKSSDSPSPPPAQPSSSSSSSAAGSLLPIAAQTPVAEDSDSSDEELVPDIPQDTKKDQKDPDSLFVTVADDYQDLVWQCKQIINKQSSLTMFLKDIKASEAKMN